MSNPPYEADRQSVNTQPDDYVIAHWSLLEEISVMKASHISLAYCSNCIHIMLHPIRTVRCKGRISTKRDTRPPMSASRVSDLRICNQLVIYVVLCLQI